MKITGQHLMGFAVGVGTSALGFYVYKKNHKKIDEFLRHHGIPVANKNNRDYATMTLEELVMEKERLEDLIAEREMPQETNGQ